MLDSGQSSRQCSTKPEGEGKLMRELQAKIRFGGPITVADYMKESLTHGTEVSRKIGNVR